MSSVVRQSAGQQPLDNIDRFCQALVTLAFARPTFADRVFVQALSRPEPEREPVVAEKSERRRTRLTDIRDDLLEEPYPSASGGTKCCSREGRSVLEQITN